MTSIFNTISLGQVPPNLRHSLSTVPSQSGTPFQPASQKLRHWPALNPSWRNLRDLAPRPLPPYAQHPRQRHTLSRGSADYYSRFQIQSIPGCMFGANFVILAQICDELSRGQAEFTINLSEMAKMTLKVKVNDLHFLYQPRVSQDACLEQIWWFLLKSVTSYRADKPNFL